MLWAICSLVCEGTHKHTFDLYLLSSASCTLDCKRLHRHTFHVLFHFQLIIAKSPVAPFAAFAYVIGAGGIEIKGIDPNIVYFASYYMQFLSLDVELTIIINLMH